MPHPPPSQADHKDDIEMEETTPPRTSGTKRSAVESPLVSPPLPADVHCTGENIEDEEMELVPARLEDKFDSHPKKKLTSNAPALPTQTEQEKLIKGQELARLSTASFEEKTEITTQETHISVVQDGEKLDWLNPKIYADLLADVTPPTPGEAIAYEFDDEDAVTTTTLLQINGIQVEEALRQKVLKCKQQDRSQAHPKWGPFRLSPADTPVGHIAVINSKGKRAHSFPKKELLIKHPTFSFKLDDSNIHTLVLLRSVNDCHTNRGGKTIEGYLS
jgi:hypothetical protein